ncbi:hypothetical protein ONZ45_g10603 [Pleurotus djamor]|nr:hypothetical protein ONZ45_g10603 [Pleurotus djamor]
MILPRNRTFDFKVAEHRYPDDDDDTSMRLDMAMVMYHHGHPCLKIKSQRSQPQTDESSSAGPLSTGEFMEDLASFLALEASPLFTPTGHNNSNSNAWEKIATLGKAGPPPPPPPPPPDAVQPKAP